MMQPYAPRFASPGMRIRLRRCSMRSVAACAAVGDASQNTGVVYGDARVACGEIAHGHSVGILNPARD